MTAKPTERRRHHDGEYARPVDLVAFRGWLERYFAAWASNDPDEVAALFADDAVYSWGPFREPAVGREDIVRAWVDGGAPPGLETSFEALAVEGDRGVAHWTVAFRTEQSQERGRTELDGILVCTFDESGRCILHHEWYDRRDRSV
jgi:ketosteroid isomerase-like protein